MVFCIVKIVVLIISVGYCENKYEWWFIFGDDEVEELLSIGGESNVECMEVCCWDFIDNNLVCWFLFELEEVVDCVRIYW